MVGFSSDKIIQDERMQLSIALYQRGLASSKYANEILNRMRPPVKRVDQISNIKLSHDFD